MRACTQGQFAPNIRYNQGVSKDHIVRAPFAFHTSTPQGSSDRSNLPNWTIIATLTGGLEEQWTLSNKRTCTFLEIERVNDIASGVSYFDRVIELYFDDTPINIFDLHINAV